jgi:hypothetical protein
MAYDRFLIAPEGFSVGLETDKRPWLIPDEAFFYLQNAYVFRGRVRKRFGSYGSGNQNFTYNSRLAVNVGTTDGSGDLSGTVPGTVFAVGQGFTIGTEIFTVYQTGTPGNMLTTGSSSTHTYNTTTGAFVFAGATPNTVVYFYPSTPVMGISLYENGPVNGQPTYAFDTQFAYVYNSGNWVRSGTGTTPQWHGTDDNFFWITNFYTGTTGQKTLFVSNFNATVPTPAATDDPIWYYNNSSWQTLTPVVLNNSGTLTTIQTSLVILPFKGRLILLNTIEQTSGVNYAFTNRCRYSFEGDPSAVNAFLEPNQTYSGLFGAGGGYVDSPTAEIITSAEFVKDRLIVYFERSTWELAFTNNQIRPFIWQKINTELGTEAPFSTVPFDKIILSIGNTGVHACNAANVERIDNKIPEKVFEIEDIGAAVNRIFGIRDYFNEMVYWTFPSDNRSAIYTYPNRILVYNYQNGSWAFNDDTITCFGYFEQQPGYTWSSTTFTWEDCDFEWDTGLGSPQARQVIAGNQQGYLFICDADISRNAPALQITNITYNATSITLTVINHNIANIYGADYILIENAQGLANINGNVYLVQSIPNLNTLVVSNNPYNPVTGAYLGGGTMALVSWINIASKQWNPYVDQDRNVYLAKIDFAVQKTTYGQITVDYSVSSTSLSMISMGTANGSIMGSNILETTPYALSTFEQYQDRLWHPIYFQGDGECVQINMYLSQAQMMNPQIALEDFELEAITLFTQQTSSRMQ